MRRPAGTPRAIAIALTLLAAAAAGAETAREEFDQTYAFPSGGRLTLSNTNGDVSIEPWDRQEIQVRATKRVKTRADEAEQALREVRIEVEGRSDGIDVDTIYPRWKSLFGWNNVSAGVEYDIRLPRRANVEVRTVNGEVEITGIAGDIDLRSTNGGLVVADSSGSVSASTTNGAIDVELAAVSSSGMEFETTNGGIRLSLPSMVQTSLVARTTNGSIETDFPIEARGTFRRNHLEGQINGGGPPIELRTTNGSIRIRER